MKFVFLDVAPAHEKWAEVAADLYQEKISHFIDFTNVSAATKKSGREDSAKKLQVESELILKQIKPDDFVILFDERGKTMDSPQFSKTIEQVLQSGKKRCVWVIGGAYGVGPEVKERANQKICLAPFVLNHLVAKTVALEQIYRAFTIIKRLPYHNS